MAARSSATTAAHAPAPAPAPAPNQPRPNTPKSQSDEMQVSKNGDQRTCTILHPCSSAQCVDVCSELLLTPLFSLPPYFCLAAAGVSTQISSLSHGRSDGDEFEATEGCTRTLGRVSNGARVCSLRQLHRILIKFRGAFCVPLEQAYLAQYLLSLSSYPQKSDTCDAILSYARDPNEKADEAVVGGSTKGGEQQKKASSKGAAAASAAGSGKGKGH
jgi:hypothetical protein